MDVEEKIKPGREAKRWRRDRIKQLVESVKGSRGWRLAFAEAYPDFNTVEGMQLLSNASMGRGDDPMLLASLEAWVPKVLEEKPDWLKKS